MKVSNGKTIRRLGWRSMKAARTRNLIAVLAIALTTVLFTSLFTIAMSINDGFQQSNFRQVGGFSHGGFKYLTEEQFNDLKDDPLIDQWGMRRFIGMPTEVPFNKSHVEVSYADANEAHWMYCDPVEGRLPQEGTDEAATDTHVLELLGVEPELIRRRVDDALAAVDMTAFMTHAPHLLSGGQKQRIAIAGVIAMEPECIVLDEATAMLDPIGRQEVLSAVHKLNREKGITVVLITHHMNEAEEADRVIVMDDGRIALDGTPKEVFTQVEPLRTMGLTVPDTVDLLDRLRKDGLDVPLDALTVDECAAAITAALAKN